MIGILIGGIVFGTLGTIAATQIASSNVTYSKNGTNITVESALDDLFNQTNSTTTTVTCTSNCKCQKATTLHTEICSQTSTSSFCRAAGYAANATITYGQIGSGKTLNPGDALDCDVNGDGTYNATNERFYYVSNYYNTTTNKFDPSIAVLIYYNNVSGGVANNTATYSYHSSNKNYEGPVTAKAQLPTTSQWKNVSLSSTTRAIKNEIGGSTSNNGSNSLPNSYSYAGYAARLLTTQEVTAACNIMVGSYPPGELDRCQYLMENTKFSSDSMGTYGYWLETPRSTGTSNYAYYNDAYYRATIPYNANDTVSGVRPAIEVSVTNIKY